MFRFNDEKVFADFADGELVVLMKESGAYYTFGSAAAAAVRDLAAGCAPERIAGVLKEKAGDAFDPDEFSRFLSDLTEKEILEKTETPIEGDPAPTACGALSFEKESFSLSVEEFDDVAEYFQVDPIHEADPALGWPYIKEK